MYVCMYICMYVYMYMYIYMYIYIYIDSVAGVYTSQLANVFTWVYVLSWSSLNGVLHDVLLKAKTTSGFCMMLYFPESYHASDEVSWPFL